MHLALDIDQLNRGLDDAHARQRGLGRLAQQPALLADPTVAEPMQVLKASPGRMAFARQVFNEAGAAYNAATTQFPTRLLGGVLRFGRAGRL